MLFIKGRARKMVRTMEGLDKKAYRMAKEFEKQHNQMMTSPALKNIF